MGFMDTVTFNECDDIKCVQPKICIQNDGPLLIVPVYLHNVCPCKELVVGVSVYINHRLYARKVKKFFIGNHYDGEKIRNFYAGDFLFLFADDCHKRIHTRVISHYIY